MRTFARVAVAVVLGGVGFARADGPPPAVVGFLVDTSGSIGPADLQTAQALGRGLLKALPPGSQMAVFTFDDQSRLVQPLTSDAESVGRVLGRAKIAGQWTALNDALYDASRYVRDAPAQRRAIVLVTDGVDENSVLNLEDALAVAEGSKIPVFTVGVGRAREKSLRRIAKLTAGSYFSGPSARGEELAKAIQTAEVAQSTLAATGGAPPGATPGSSPATTSATRRAGVLIGGGLLLALVLVLALNRKSSPRCPRCGTELRSPLETCPSCAPRGEEQPKPPSEPMPETVFQRLQDDDEHLEKTITLREAPVLAIVKGAAAGVVYSLSPESAVSVGRARANDIVLSDVAISSQHCRIRQEEGRFVVHDLRSTNGTFVNDRRVSRCVLEEGDTIKVGETLLQFRTDHRRM
jgi:hypothetical protein